MKTASALTVRSLLCHRDVNMAIACLGSLLKFSVEPIKLTLHNDGSLTKEDQERLTQELGQVTFVSRLEADELTRQFLKNYPNCYKYRHELADIGKKNGNIWSLKLFDVALLGNENDIAYCDSDILFFQPFSKLFHFSDSKTSAIFMKDSQESYSVHALTLLNSREIRLPNKANAGLILFKRKNFDLDFIEWFLERKKFKYIFAFAEQTIWAALGNRAGCKHWSPKQVKMMTPKVEVTDRTVAAHFTTPFRYLLKQYLINDETISVDVAPIEVETIEASECSAVNLAKVHSKIHLGALKKSVFQWR